MTEKGRKDTLAAIRSILDGHKTIDELAKERRPSVFVSVYQHEPDGLFEVFTANGKHQFTRQELDAWIASLQLRDDDKVFVFTAQHGNDPSVDVTDQSAAVTDDTPVKPIQPLPVPEVKADTDSYPKAEKVKAEPTAPAAGENRISRFQTEQRVKLVPQQCEIARFEIEL